MKEIIVEISPDGKVSVRTQGFVGRECYEASRLIEEALGQVTEDKKTAEYFAQQSERRVNHVKNCSA